MEGIVVESGGVSGRYVHEEGPGTLYLKVDEIGIIDLLIMTGLCKSRTEAKNLIKQGGVYIATC